MITLDPLRRYYFARRADGSLVQLGDHENARAARESAEADVQAIGNVRDFPEVTDLWLDSLGYTPYWLKDAIENGARTQDEYIQHCLACYGFGSYPMTGGEVKPDGMYSYPDDPDMPPLISWRLPGGVMFYQYPYGIVAFTDSAETYVARWD